MFIALYEHTTSTTERIIDLFTYLWIKYGNHCFHDMTGGKVLS